MVMVQEEAAATAVQVFPATDSGDVTPGLDRVSGALPSLR
jgi:hypothetical protein